MGDTSINVSSKSHRHNQVLRGVFVALTACIYAGQASGTLKMADRSDGTSGRLSNEEFRKRYDHINSTHVPDLM